MTTKIKKHSPGLYIAFATLFAWALAFLPGYHNEGERQTMIMTCTLIIALCSPLFATVEPTRAKKQKKEKRKK